jgi:hypothetical protein
MSELQWNEIADRFSNSRNWWIHTTGPSGPHAVPVWGAVVDGSLVFYGSPSSIRSRNIAADPRVVLHLEDGDAPLILHATATPGGIASDRPALVEAYRAKYTKPTDAEFLPDTDYGATVVVYDIEPRTALAWVIATGDEWKVRRWAK